MATMNPAYAQADAMYADIPPAPPEPLPGYRCATKEEVKENAVRIFLFRMTSHT